MPNVQQHTSPHSSDSSSSHGSESPPERAPQQQQQQPQQQEIQQPQRRSNSEASSGSGSSTVARSSTTSKTLSRRGHFKSRLGCFNCKRRRVKCNELRPSCSPCCRLGLTCSYPTPPAASSSTSPRALPSTLAWEDLRFYHQFLMAAFPTLPLKADDVWMQAAAMSHDYDFLAHAVLGLGASHVSQNGNVDYSSQALQHRVMAIKLVNEQLDKPPKKPADADALLAAIICLVSQSCLMPDSMIEYLTMTRGGNLVATTVITDYNVSIFKNFTPEGHVESLTKLICEQPKDLVILEGYRSSVLLLEPLCHTPNESAYFTSLLRAIIALRTSCLEAWREFVMLFVMPTTFTNEDFLSFINPENHASHLLIIHMFLLDYILGQACIAKSENPKFPGRKNMVISWTKNLYETLPSEYRKYLEWPLYYCDILAKLDSRYLLSP